MIEYNIVIKLGLEVKDADLLNDHVMVERWNKLTIADENPEFLGEHKCVIRYGSITDGEDNIDTDKKNRKIDISIWNLVYRENMMTG